MTPIDLAALLNEPSTKYPLQIGYGKATFPSSSITIAGFVVEPEFVRTLASKKIDKSGRTLSIPVSQYPDIDGYLYSDQLYATDGTVLLIQVSVKYNGARIRDGGLFIRTRNDGPSLLVTAHIPHDARCRLNDHNHTVFSGNGDILTMDDLEAEGFSIPKKYADAYMEQEELDECFNITVIRPARASAPKVEVHTSDSGEKVTLRVDKGVRRMRLRRDPRKG